MEIIKKTRPDWANNCWQLSRSSTKPKRVSVRCIMALASLPSINDSLLQGLQKVNNWCMNSVFNWHCQTFGDDTYLVTENGLLNHPSIVVKFYSGVTAAPHCVRLLLRRFPISKCSFRKLRCHAVAASSPFHFAWRYATAEDVSLAWQG